MPEPRPDHVAAPEDVIRRALWFLSEYQPIRPEALDALDVILAERQRWEDRAWRAERKRTAAEAEVRQLCEALERITAGLKAPESEKIARAALAAVGEPSQDRETPTKGTA